MIDITQITIYEVLLTIVVTSAIYTACEAIYKAHKRKKPF